MKSTTFTFKDHDGIDIFTYKWLPDSGEPKGCIQIAHGLGEHAERYAGFAERFTAEGFACYANDHRGHGRTAGVEARRGILGPGGWDSVVKDLKQLTDIIKNEFPGKPVFYVGHSWGSYLGQDYAQRFGSALKGLVQSGSTGHQSFVVQNFGVLLARRAVRKLGADTPSGLAYDLTFKAFNKAFLPSPTGTDFDWLSRDPAVVKKYTGDPWCGFKISNGASLQMILGMKNTWKPQNERKMPAALPQLFLSGTMDSTSRFLKDLKPLVKRYQAAYGFKDVTAKYYEGARHEVFNETNRGEVFADLLQWLKARL
jgi:alpha-beta hydrolase superfamily lysophospholipase